MKTAVSEPSNRARTLYVETSALLAALLEGEPAARHALRGGFKVTASALTLAEAARAVARHRAGGVLSNEKLATVHRDLRTFERRCRLVPISPPILAQIGLLFPVEPVRTLDAIHLVTARMLGVPPGEVLLLTRDRRVRANAAALGFVLD